MARLLLSDLQTQVQDFLPGKGLSKIARMANLALREIYREAGPTGRGVFNLLAPLSAGTVAVTQDGTGVIGTGTAFASTFIDGGIIQVEGETTWFPVSVVADANNLTLGAEWSGESASGLTYTMVQPVVLMPDNVGDVLGVWVAGQHELRRVMDELRIDPYGILRLQTPRFFSFQGYGTSGKRKLLVHFPQDARYACTYIYREAATLYDPGDVTSSTTLPPEWDDLVVAGTLFYGYIQEHDTEKAGFWKREYKDLLKQIKARDLSGYFGQLRSRQPDGTIFYHEQITES